MSKIILIKSERIDMPDGGFFTLTTYDYCGFTLKSSLTGVSILYEGHKVPGASRFESIPSAINFIDFHFTDTSN
jgi:hypothetical protein